MNQTSVGLTQKRPSARDGLLKGLALLVFYSGYPALLGIPVVTRGQLTTPGAVSNDWALSLFRAQGFSRMPFPWTPTTFFNYPTATLPWRIENITSLFTESATWLLSHVFPANIAITIYALVGIALCGFLAYQICVELKIHSVLCVFAGLLVQMLPSMRQLLVTGIAAPWNPVLPLLMCLVVVRGGGSSQSEFKTFRSLGIALVISFFQATYTFYFCVVIFLIWMILNSSQLWRRTRNIRTRKVVLWIGASMAVLLLITLTLVFALRFTVNEYGENYGVYSAGEVLKDSYSPSRFIKPDKFHLVFPSTDYWEVEGYSQQYGGFLIFSGALVSLYWSLVQRRNDTMFFLTLVTVAFFVMSLGRFELFGTEIPSIREYLRFVMIGNRRFAIAGILFQVLSVLHFVRMLDRIAKNH